MRISVNQFVSLTVLTALAAGGALYGYESIVPAGSMTPLLVLALLALFAEVLGFVLPRAAQGSIAFIPYLATILVVPSWAAVLSVTVVKLVFELLSRKPLQRSIFNIASHSLALSAALGVYWGLGGESLLSLSNPSLFEASAAVGFAAISAFVVSIVLNTLVTSTVIAIANNTNPLRVWREIKGSSIALDLLSTTIVFVFGWIFARFGPIAAVASWVPVLGLRQVHKSHSDLEQTSQELLELMVKSIEARDPYTSGHSRRVSRYSIVIARGIGLSDKVVERIGTAALLHDVGKIHEKYAPILSKTERLSADEWITMKEHPIDGANLVSTISQLSDILPAVRHHHENWDGTGYPDGLAGELIPLASRIIMFADTIDAMTSERPYRKAMDAHDVRAEIVRCRGRQFDPNITDRLLSQRVWSSMFPSDGAIPSTKLAVVQDKIRTSA